MVKPHMLSIQTTIRTRCTANALAFCKKSGKVIVVYSTKPSLIISRQFADGPRNDTLVLKIFGKGIKSAHLGIESNFQFLAYKVSTALDPYSKAADIEYLNDGRISHLMRDVVAHVRLVSLSSYLNGYVKKSDQNGYHNVTYLIDEVPQETGDSFRLHLRITWLRGGLLSPILPLGSLKVTSQFLVYSKYLNHIVYNETIEIIKNNNNKDMDSDKFTDSHTRTSRDTGSSTALSSSAKPICLPDQSLKGRWRKVRPNEPCPPSICSGNKEELSWLNDNFNFNRDWVWSPDACNLHLYSKEEVTKCFVDNDYRHVVISGDSLVREHFQNILSLLVPVEELRLDKVKSQMHININLTSSFESNFHFYYIVKELWMQLQSHGGYADVHLWGLTFLRFLTSNSRDEDLEKQFNYHFTDMRSRANQITNSTRISTRPASFTYLIHPAIQFEDNRVGRDRLAMNLTTNGNGHGVSSFACMTPTRFQMALKVIRSRLREENLTFIDGEEITLSRWESSHDGVHYSLFNTLTFDNNNNNNNNNDNFTASAPSSVSGTITPCRNGDSLSQMGKGMCPRIRHQPLVNTCIGDDLFWCKSKASPKKYDSFEGGVSRMLTMIWINKICN
eukprot:gene13094-27633_t